jgi:hypothetical protein
MHSEFVFGAVVLAGILQGTRIRDVKGSDGAGGGVAVFITLMPADIVFLG